MLERVKKFLKQLVGIDHDDLKNESLKTLPQWDDRDPAQSLDALYVLFVHSPCTETINWYFKSRRWKRRFGLGVRLLAIAAAGAGAIIPIIGGKYIISISKYTIEIESEWAAIALLIGAGLIWVDRLLGLTSGWTRYVLSGLEAAALREESAITWMETKRAWSISAATAKPVPDPTQIDTALKLIKGMSQQVREIVRKETSEWVTEFRSSLEQIDSLVKARLQESQKRLDEFRAKEEEERKKAQVDAIAKATAIKDAILNVTVPNGAGCVVVVDNGAGSKVTKTGQIVGFKDLAPGSWEITATGTVTDTNGNPVTDANGNPFKGFAGQTLFLKAGDSPSLTLNLAKS